MKKIEVITHAFETEDGRVFDDEGKAKTHEMKLKLLGIISEELIDAIAPEHSRSSCSDDFPSNAWRCTRCSLLRAMEDPDGFLDESIKVDFHIYRED